MYESLDEKIRAAIREQRVRRLKPKGVIGLVVGAASAAIIAYEGVKYAIDKISDYEQERKIKERF